MTFDGRPNVPPIIPAQAPPPPPAALPPPAVVPPAEVAEAPRKRRRALERLGRAQVLLTRGGARGDTTQVSGLQKRLTGE